MFCHTKPGSAALAAQEAERNQNMNMKLLPHN